MMDTQTTESQLNKKQRWARALNNWIFKKLIFSLLHLLTTEIGLFHSQAAS